jgi:hypothetical protein
MQNGCQATIQAFMPKKVEPNYFAGTIITFKPSKKN